MVTGPKTDLWLVKTVSVMGLCVAFTFLASYVYKEESRSILWLAICTPVGFTILDIYYYIQGTLTWTYLIDAALQIIVLTGYLIILLRSENYKH